MNLHSMIFIAASLISVCVTSDAFQIGLLKSPTSFTTRSIDAESSLQFSESQNAALFARKNFNSELYSSASSSAIDGTNSDGNELGFISSTLTKIGMISFMISQCISMPLILIPPLILRKARLISSTQSETMSLRGGQFCARWCLRLIPFAKLKVIPPEDGSANKSNNSVPEPSIWVCNHMSMLDVFFLLAADKKMRGRNKRPIKIVYWKDLEANPVTAFLFKMCGFIPIQMVANAPGEDNQYDTKSFKAFLRAAKQAFNDGFDIGILPEGQLNPSPESGLLPVFSGAYTLARMSKRPIKMVALNGTNKIWHATDGLIAKGRSVKVRAYPSGKKFENADDFTETFTEVVGHFGAKGHDTKNLEKWL